MKLVNYEEIYRILSSKEEHIVHMLKRNARRSSLHLSPADKMLRNQKIEAQNVALNTLLKEIRDIIDRILLNSSNCNVRRFYLVTLKDLKQLQKNSLIFYMAYEGSLCKVGVTMNTRLTQKYYHLYVPSIEKNITGKSYKVSF